MMRGPVGLVGSGEFTSTTSEIDLLLLRGRPQRAVVIPTASALDGSKTFQRWLELGESHFRSLGVEPVSLPVADRAHADDRKIAAQIEGAGLIYFSGGDPEHLCETLRDTALWAAVLEAWRSGTALAGCSAGAMMMGSQTRSPRKEYFCDALNLFDDLVVIPHFDRINAFRPGMADEVAAAVPESTTVLGVDEDTGLVLTDDGWQVVGLGGAWLVGPEGVEALADATLASFELRPR
ncbi:MAG: Type 1 glutamine amidotransferase-like domain-containing protein [Acidimicrobiia bacterium]|nr:Type 1 glutamine amidotransferase-like domain-containing protein [Acidimicrobiia bacterium]